MVEHVLHPLATSSAVLAVLYWPNQESPPPVMDSAPALPQLARQEALPHTLTHGVPALPLPPLRHCAPTPIQFL